MAKGLVLRAITGSNPSRERASARGSVIDSSSSTRSTVRFEAATAPTVCPDARRRKARRRSRGELGPPPPPIGLRGRWC